MSSQNKNMRIRSLHFIKLDTYVALVNIVVSNVTHKMANVIVL